MRVVDLLLAWRTNFILHRFDGQVREEAAGRPEVRHVQAVSRYAFEVLGKRQAVICADPSEVAIHLYQSLGYVPVDRAHMLQRRAPQDRP